MRDLLKHLYDIGFDIPETHAIKKNDVLYYAFYAKEYSGPVQLRGLERGTYKVKDYANQKELGVVSSESAQLEVDFKEYLLIEVSPEKS